MPSPSSTPPPARAETYGGCLYALTRPASIGSTQKPHDPCYVWTWTVETEVGSGRSRACRRHRLLLTGSSTCLDEHKGAEDDRSQDAA
ncbi:hypothetical protein INR49_021362, partial [Caranx melampygus]